MISSTNLKYIKTGNKVGAVGNHFGWISYTQKEDLNLGDKYIVEKDETGGSLISLSHTEKFYDYARVEDCFALEEIFKCERKQ